MNNVTAKQFGVSSSEGLCAGSLEPPRHAAPKDVVLTAGVDSYDRPHVVVVRHQRHIGRPHNIQDGQIRRSIKRAESRTNWFTQCLQDGGRLRYDPRYDIAYGLVSPVSGERVAAIFDEVVYVKRHFRLLRPGQPKNDCKEYR